MKRRLKGSFAVLSRRTGDSHTYAHRGSSR